jgi:nucleoside 2-deoxyribosyltransferase
VVELSEKGVGVGIEAGYARAKGKPIITVARRESDVSDTLRGISREVFIYQDKGELEKFFGNVL